MTRCYCVALVVQLPVHLAWYQDEDDQMLLCRLDCASLWHLDDQMLLCRLDCACLWHLDDQMLLCRLDCACLWHLDDQMLLCSKVVQLLA